MKPMPVVGTLVLVGAIVEAVLGFQVAGGMDAFLGIHVLVGVVGLILVAVLAVTAFRVKTATVYSKLAIAILSLVVIVQLALGFEVMGGAEDLISVHMVNAGAILILCLLTGGITFSSARRKSLSAAAS